MDNKVNFIKTNSEETASTLRSLGYTELNKQGAFFCFLNDGKQDFSKEHITNNTIIYTNKICI